METKDNTKKKIQTYNYYGSLGRWTQLAKDCYRRNMNCEGCELLPELESGKCQMKSIVVELIKKFGAPPRIQSIFFGIEVEEIETKVLKIIKNGARTYKDITKAGGNTSVISRLKVIASSGGMKIKKNYRFIEELQALLQADSSIFFEIKSRR